MRKVIFEADEEMNEFKVYTNDKGTIDFEMDDEDITLEISLEKEQIEKLIAALQKSIQ